MKLVGGEAAHHLHQIGWHAKRQRARAHHHHLRDSGGEWQHQPKAGARARLGVGFDATAQGHHIGAHHIHTDTATRQRRGFGGGAQPRLEHQLGRVGIAQPSGVGNHTELIGALAKPNQVETSAVVTEGHRDIVQFLGQTDLNLSLGWFASRPADLWAFDAMHHTVAQQVLEGSGHAVQNPPIHFNVAAGDVQPHLFAGFL